MVTIKPLPAPSASVFFLTEMAIPENKVPKKRMNMMVSLTIPCHPSHNCTIMA